MSGDLVCGKLRNNTNVNNTDITKLDKYPWTVGLMRKDESNFFCGGVLISATFVLTAAHCVDKENMRKSADCAGPKVPEDCFLSANDLQVGVVDSKKKNVVKRKNVQRIRPHRGYSSKLNRHDIALIELKVPVSCDDGAMPVCLPQEDMGNVGNKLISATWTRRIKKRKSPVLLVEKKVTLVNKNECKSKHKSRILCAKGSDKSSYSQQYSGTAIFGRLQKRYYALGIMSDGPEDVSPDKPDTYSNVYYYMKWIKKKVEDLPKAPKTKKTKEEGGEEETTEETTGTTEKEEGEEAGEEEPTEGTTEEEGTTKEEGGKEGETNATSEGTENAEESTSKSTDKSTEKSTPKSTDKSSSKSTDKSTDKSTSKSTDKSTTNRPTNRPPKPQPSKVRRGIGISTGECSNKSLM
ncbi:serine protease 38 [Caerostris darwini]|uniref:Serine protease 38 n=1 Tax=Caerostris darwini TaxID=1538125 RepID=A0AAV4VWL9_9ARAC|nr:serine protease 38 [Caerostris darwini]